MTDNINSFAAILYVCVYGINSFERSGISKLCDQQHFIHENGSFAVTFTPGTLNERAQILSNQYSSSCQMFITHSGLLLRAQINYRPVGHGCHLGYLSVGNDEYRPDIVSMTSYQFCENVTIDIVSRSNVLWFIVKRRFGTHIEGNIVIESRRQVSCNTSQYECSPLQCVPLTSLCNNKKDCDNGRDEYCDSSASDQCFLCDDGTCISPTLPRYYYNWGKPFWFICDGFNHCRDGSDEMIDKCHSSWSPVSDLYSCQSKSLGKYILTWDDQQCKRNSKCVNGDCYNSSVLKRINGSSIAITVCAFCIVLLFSTCFYIRSGKIKRRRQTSSDGLSSRCRIYRDVASDDITTNLHRLETEEQT